MNITLFNKIGSQWVILLVAVAAYAILAVVDPDLLREVCVFLGETLLHTTPILAVVFALMFVSNLFIKSEVIVDHLGEGSHLKGWLIAVLGGIISSGPIYMWYPLLGDLQEKGARKAVLVTFLYNRAVKIPLLPLMIYYFGSVFVVVLTVYMIIFSIINGVLVERFMRTQKGVSGV